MLESSIYCNALNLIHLHSFLVKMNAFGFACIACSRFKSILCNTPIFWRAISFIHHFSANYCIFMIFALISKYHQWFYPLLSWILPFFLNKENQAQNSIKTYVQYPSFWKKSIKETNHPGSHVRPTLHSFAPLYLSINLY